MIVALSLRLAAVGGTQNTCALELSLPLSIPVELQTTDAIQFCNAAKVLRAQSRLQLVP
jgi:hypothetical protein